MDYANKVKKAKTSHLSMGKKSFSCDFESCDYMCARSYSLTVHKRIHSGERPYSCDQCDYKCTTSDHLKVHKRTHSGERPFSCDFLDCDFKCTTSEYLKVHQRIHTGEKPYSCDSCDFKCTTSEYLKVHQRIHTGEKPYSCDFLDCDYKCTTSSSLTVHKRFHTGEKTYKCDQCDFKCATSSILSRHRKIHISIERTRGKPQESRLVDRLNEWGYCVDVEVTIDFAKRNCVGDTDRYVSRLDFVILNCTSHILIIECDEKQHMFYELRCELSRMTDVHSALVLAGYKIPVHWIRYSPCGAYRVGGQTRFGRRIARENMLRKYLDNICSGEISPIGDMSIHYMFYDRESDLSAPKILSDADFLPWLKDVVTFQ